MTAIEDQLLSCVVQCANDHCPAERSMMLCQMQEDPSGDSCVECWCNYALWIANGKRWDPYRNARSSELLN